jgi:hypothetical protein
MTASLVGVSSSGVLSATPVFLILWVLLLFNQSFKRRRCHDRFLLLLLLLLGDDALKVLRSLVPPRHSCFPDVVGLFLLLVLVVVLVTWSGVGHSCRLLLCRWY